MGWVIAGIAVFFALVVIYSVKAILLLARGIVLLGIALMRGLASLLD